MQTTGRSVPVAGINQINGNCLLYRYTLAVTMATSTVTKLNTRLLLLMTTQQIIA